MAIGQLADYVRLVTPGPHRVLSGCRRSSALIAASSSSNACIVFSNSASVNGVQTTGANPGSSSITCATVSSACSRVAYLDDFVHRVEHESVEAQGAGSLYGHPKALKVYSQ
jgi:hypothetical protein